MCVIAVYLSSRCRAIFAAFDQKQQLATLWRSEGPELWPTLTYLSSKRVGSAYARIYSPTLTRLRPTIEKILP